MLILWLNPVVDTVRDDSYTEREECGLCTAGVNSTARRAVTI